MTKKYIRFFFNRSKNDSTILNIIFLCHSPPRLGRTERSFGQCTIYEGKYYACKIYTTIFVGVLPISTKTGLIHNHIKTIS